MLVCHPGMRVCVCVGGRNTQWTRSETVQTTVHHHHCCGRMVFFLSSAAMFQCHIQPGVLERASLVVVPMHSNRWWCDSCCHHRAKLPAWWPFLRDVCGVPSLWQTASILFWVICRPLTSDETATMDLILITVRQTKNVWLTASSWFAVPELHIEQTGNTQL